MARNKEEGVVASNISHSVQTTTVPRALLRILSAFATDETSSFFGSPTDSTCFNLAGFHICRYQPSEVLPAPSPLLPGPAQNSTWQPALASVAARVQNGIPIALVAFCLCCFCFGCHSQKIVAKTNHKSLFFLLIISCGFNFYFSKNY